MKSLAIFFKFYFIFYHPSNSLALNPTTKAVRIACEVNEIPIVYGFLLKFTPTHRMLRSKFSEIILSQTRAKHKQLHAFLY